MGTALTRAAPLAAVVTAVVGAGLLGASLRGRRREALA